MEESTRIKYQLKALTIVLMIGLIVSGISAFPLEKELDAANKFFSEYFPHSSLTNWITLVYSGVSSMDKQFPFMAYGTDWLAFAHLMIAFLYIGVLRDPVKNIWIVEWSMITSVTIFPLAFIAGSIRGIPFFHQLIDCSFGVIGFILSYIMRQKILQLKKREAYK